MPGAGIWTSEYLFFSKCTKIFDICACNNKDVDLTHGGVMGSAVNRPSML